VLRYRMSVLAAVTTVLVGCISTGSAPDGNATSPVAGPQLVEPHPCDGIPDFTCTTLRVPLDHARRDGRLLELSVAAADNTAAPRGVLLLLAGGPGQPGVALVNRIRTYFDPEVLRQYRLVMFDQRGTGPKGIDCAELQTAIGGSDFLTPPQEAVEACGRQLGADRDYYRTTDTVEDVDWLRQALGQARLTIDGVSYGTFSGAQYALKYPGRVQALVLDSVVPHKGIDPFGVDLMAATRRVLAATCATNPACTTDPVADLAWLLRNGLIDGEPINGTAFVESLAVTSLNAVDPSLRGIPKLLNDARQGDTGPLKEYFQQFSSRGTPADQLSAGLHLATLCADLRFPWGTSQTAPDERPAALDRAVRRLSPAQLHPYDAPTARSMLIVDGCLHWPVARPSSYPKQQRLLPRTLILHGQNDLFCPVEWAYWSKSQSARAHLVVVPGGGHGVQGSRTDPTGKNAVRSFLLG